MSESTGGLAFITNLRIGNKIAAGFGLILLILTVSSVMVYLAFGQVASAIEGYAELVATSAPSVTGWAAPIVVAGAIAAMSAASVINVPALAAPAPAGAT